MGIYTGLDEAALEAKIAELTAQYEKLVSEGGVARVSGEGRMMEFTRSNPSALLGLINEAKAELAVLRGEPDPRNAIGVIF